MDTSLENKNRYAALGLTIGIHAALFSAFLFIVFITPLPPFAASGSIVLEWSSGAGNGNTYPDTPAAAAVPGASKPSKTENVITDPEEKNVFMKAAKTTPEADSATIAEEKTSAELLNALSVMKGKKSKGSNRSTTGGNRTVISPAVTESSTSLLSLADRKLISKPERLTDATEEGTVIVQIVVDETGKVIRAIPGQRGSTTVSAVLNAKARQAAMALRFNESAEGIKEQRGTYTFIFTLE